MKNKMNLKRPEKLEASKLKKFECDGDNFAVNEQEKITEFDKLIDLLHEYTDNEDEIHNFIEDLDDEFSKIGCNFLIKWEYVLYSLLSEYGVKDHEIEMFMKDVYDQHIDLTRDFRNYLYSGQLENLKMFQQNSYSPYSNFKVGAIALTNKGKCFGGCNVENASYGLTNCAERTAIFKAIAEGVKKGDLTMLMIMSKNQFPPCGACRQVIVELFDPDGYVAIFNEAGEYYEMRVRDLLPMSFSESDLHD